MIQASRIMQPGAYQSLTPDRKSPIQQVQETVSAILSDFGVELTGEEALNLSVNKDGKIEIEGLSDNIEEISEAVNENEELKKLLITEESNSSLSRWNQEAATLEISPIAIEAYETEAAKKIDETITQVSNQTEGPDTQKKSPYGNRGLMHSLFKKMGMNQGVLSKILTMGAGRKNAEDVLDYQKEIHDLAVKSREDTGQMINDVLAENGIAPIEGDEEIEISVDDEGGLRVKALGGTSSDRAKEIEEALNGSSSFHEIMSGMKLSSGLMELLTQRDNVDGESSKGDWVIPVDTDAVLSLLTEAMVGVSLSQFEDKEGNFSEKNQWNDELMNLLSDYEKDMGKQITSWAKQQEEMPQEQLSEEKMTQMISAEKSAVSQNLSSEAAKSISTTFTFSNGILKDERSETAAKNAVKDATSRLSNTAAQLGLDSFTAKINPNGIIEGAGSKTAKNMIRNSLPEVYMDQIREFYQSEKNSSEIPDIQISFDKNEGVTIGIIPTGNSTKSETLFPSLF